MLWFGQLAAFSIATDPVWFVNACPRHRNLLHLLNVTPEHMLVIQWKRLIVIRNDWWHLDLWNIEPRLLPVFVERFFYLWCCARFWLLSIINIYFVIIRCWGWNCKLWLVLHWYLVSLCYTSFILSRWAWVVLRKFIFSKACDRTWHRCVMKLICSWRFALEVRCYSISNWI